MTTPHMMAEWRAGGIYGDPSCAADRAWMQFLDVLTGHAGSADCPTLEELDMGYPYQKGLHAPLQLTNYRPPMTTVERDCWWELARAAYYAGHKHVAEYIRVVRLSGHVHRDDTPAERL